jgi:integrase
VRALMGLMRDRHGTYYARKKVPVRLQAAVARVLAQGKTSQSFLKKSLGTKDLKAANIRAKPVQAGFDRVFGEAEQLLTARPIRETLGATEIKRMAEALYGRLLSDDEAWRFGGRAFMVQAEAQLRREGVEATPHYPLHTLPEFGWSPEQLSEQRANLASELQTMQEALARGDISAVVDDVSRLLGDFQIDVDKSSASYRELGTQALRAYVSALQAIEKRNAGQPVETPKFTEGFTSDPEVGGTLRDALEGWNKERVRPEDSVHEYTRAVELFIQLHDDLPVAAIKKSHALRYREALQEVPKKRSGELLKASLPELTAWGRKHPDAPRVSAGTINKQLGAMQAVCEWAFARGVIPEDTPWANPFAKMRVQGEDSERTAFENADLKLLFAAPVFTEHEYPEGGRGPAAFWLPLLSLFNGARQTELASLTVADVQQEPETSTPLLYITAQASRGRKLKTKSSRRVVPIHTQLVKLGFLKFVEDVRKRYGDKAFLFPLIETENGRAGVKGYSKWFGRYLRAQGVTDTTKVFHSFRHGFKDALRRGEVNQEIHDALTGHAQASTVSGGYGAKEMLARFGVKVLKSAVAKVAYRGLDLSRVRPFVVAKSTRIRK